MKYRKGHLSVEQVRDQQGNYENRYKCVFETSKYRYVGYTGNGEICDYFFSDNEHLYHYGVVGNVTTSIMLVSWAKRQAYKTARNGERQKK